MIEEQTDFVRNENLEENKSNGLEVNEQITKLNDK